LIFTLPGKEEAKAAGERLRKKVEENIFRAYDERLKITVSIGIAVYPNDTHEAMGLTEKADRALYAAKSAGKNVVCVYGKG
jgi:diguanylate cyclase